jgi:hypothetical protein
MRCLPVLRLDPAIAAVSDLFADAGCSTPVRLASACTTPSSAVTTDASCPAREHVYAIGAPWTAPVYVGAPGACLAGTPLAPLYQLGDELLPTEFAGGAISVG